MKALEFPLGRRCGGVFGRLLPDYERWCQRRALAKEMSHRISTNIEKVEASINSLSSENERAVFDEIKACLYSLTPGKKLRLVPGDEIAAVSMLIDPSGMIAVQFFMELERRFGKTIELSRCKTIMDIIRILANDE